MENNNQENIWIRLIGIYLIALVFRLIFIKIIAWNSGFYYESSEIAQNIVSGMGYWWNWYGAVPFQPTAILPPIYTYYTALFIALFHETGRYFYISQAIINSVGIIPSYYLGKYWGSHKTGLIAASLFALFPEFALMSAKPAAESILFPFLPLIFLLFFICKDGLSRNNSAIPFLGLGIIIGIATLIKTTAAFIIPTGCLSLLLARPFRFKTVVAAFLLGLGFILAIAPWSIRNTIVMNKPVILNTMYGYNLWRGNHAGSSGTGRLDTERGSESSLDPAYREYIEKQHPASELALDSFYLAEAKKAIKDNPGRFVWLTLKRAFYFITFDPTHPLTRNVVYIGGYLFAVIFGVWGAIQLKKSRKFDIIFILTFLIFLAFYSPVIILPRYRLTVVWMLVALSSVSVSNVLVKLNLIKNNLNMTHKVSN